jgi:hypothetical protein
LAKEAHRSQGARFAAEAFAQLACFLHGRWCMVQCFLQCFELAFFLAGAQKTAVKIKIGQADTAHFHAAQSTAI